MECTRRMREAKESGEPHFYMMEMASGLIIDARQKGNVARLINSSCAPNAESQKWHDAATGEAPAVLRKGFALSAVSQPSASHSSGQNAEGDLEQGVMSVALAACNK